MASIWRNPTIVTFVDDDDRQIAQLTNPDFVPRVGENVRLARVPYIVERVGYDIPSGAIERIWIVCRLAS